MPYADPDEQREYQRTWTARRRSDWLSGNGPCADCGSWEQLEVDHVDPGSKVDHKVWSWSKVRRETELAKCVARCKKCHRAKSNTEAPRGEDNGQAKLTAENVIEILRSTESNSILAARFGVRRDTVREIRLRKWWRHLDVEPVDYDRKCRKFTEEQIKDALSRHEKGESFRSIARSQGRDHVTISRLIRKIKGC